MINISRDMVEPLNIYILLLLLLLPQIIITYELFLWSLYCLPSIEWNKYSPDKSGAYNWY